MSFLSSLVSSITGAGKELEATKAENEKLKKQVQALKKQKNSKPNIVQNIQIVNNHNTTNQQQIINKVTSHTSNKLTVKKKKNVNSLDLLKNKSFALCGTFSMLQKDLEATINRNGGHIAKEVDAETDYMLVGNDVSVLPNNSKSKNAQKHNTPILREQFILDVDSKKKWCSISKKYKFESSKAITSKSKSVSGSKRKLSESDTMQNAIEAPPKKKAKVAEKKASGSSKSNVFKSKNFVLCGTLSTSQTEMKRAIADNGGNVMGKVDASTNYVVIGNTVKSLPSSEKSRDAGEFGVPLVREQFVFDCVEQQKLKNLTKKYKYEK